VETFLIRATGSGFFIQPNLFGVDPSKGRYRGEVGYRIAGQGFKNNVGFIGFYRLKGGFSTASTPQTR